MTIGSVGPKGQVVIPKDMRDRLGIRPGSKVRIVLNEDGHVVEIRPGWDDPIVDGPRLIQSYPVTPEAAASGETASEYLLRVRREDNELWETKYRRWTAGASSSTPTRSSRSSSTNLERGRSPRS